MDLKTVSIFSKQINFTHLLSRNMVFCLQGRVQLVLINDCLFRSTLLLYKFPTTITLHEVFHDQSIEINTAKAT